MKVVNKTTMEIVMVDLNTLYMDSSWKWEVITGDFMSGAAARTGSLTEKIIKNDR